MAYIVRDGVTGSLQAFNIASRGAADKTAVDLSRKPGRASMQVWGDDGNGTQIELSYAYRGELVRLDKKSDSRNALAVDDPDAFTSDSPTAVLIRQVLGAVAQFEKANLVAKLKRARDNASVKAGHRVEGRAGHTRGNPDLVAKAKALSAKGMSLLTISAQLATDGHVTTLGNAFSASQVKRLIDH